MSTMVDVKGSIEYFRRSDVQRFAAALTHLGYWCYDCELLGRIAQLVRAHR
jgi:hypothetical protein